MWVLNFARSFCKTFLKYIHSLSKYQLAPHLLGVGVVKNKQTNTHRTISKTCYVASDAWTLEWFLPIIFILHVLSALLQTLHSYEIHTTTLNPTSLTKFGPLTCWGQFIMSLLLCCFHLSACSHLLLQVLYWDYQFFRSGTLLVLCLWEMGSSPQSPKALPLGK